MSAYAFTALFTAAVSLAFGLWVLSINPRNPTNQRWMFLTLAIFFWSFGQFMREMVQGIDAAQFWGRYVLYLGAAMIPVTFTHFVIEYVGERTRPRKVIVAAAYASAALVLTGIYTTDLIIKGMGPNPFFRFYIDPGGYYFLFLIHFVGTFAAGLTLLIQGIRHTSGLKKDQLWIILAATIIGFLGGSTTFLPILQIEVFPFGNYFVSLYVFLISYGIFRLELMDINIFIRKSLSGSLVILTFIIPTLLFLVMAQNYFFQRFDLLFTILVAMIIVASVLAFPKVRLKAEETVEQFLFPGLRDDRKTIARLSQEAVSILDLSRLLRSLVATLSNNFQTGQVAIMILDEKREQYRILESIGYESEFIENVQLGLRSSTALYFQENPDTLYRETWETNGEGPDREVFDRLQAVLIIPLVVRSQLVGLILMGDKEKSRPYSLDDLGLLRTLANQAAIAIENARLYEDLKTSKQYIRRADRLASLGTLSAGLAHEIRNPLVSVKTFLQLLPERFEDADFKTSFLNIATDEVERIQKLIDELLHFAKPSEPDLQYSDLNEIVDKTALLVKNELKGKEIVLTKSFDPDLPPILSDKEQIKQVILNIIINAVQAMGKRGILKIETRAVGLAGPKPSVQVEITDDGPGIPEEDLEFLFNPFFTTKHAGSGLGLAISHQIIKEHHGSIEVESVSGKGTSFFVSLPLDPRSYERRRTRVG
jgi:signal transduction histidine kinase